MALSIEGKEEGMPAAPEVNAGDMDAIPLPDLRSSELQITMQIQTQAKYFTRICLEQGPEQDTLSRRPGVKGSGSMVGIALFWLWPQRPGFPAEAWFRQFLWGC